MNVTENYYKEAFTKDQEKLNLDVNKISIDCITSKNNHFSLDEEGNLIVKSITYQDSNYNLNKQEILNYIYPVGSIYLSVSNTNPSTLFGGTWEEMAKGKTLVGVDQNDSDFAASKKIGGSKYIQNHTHKYSSETGSFAGASVDTWGLTPGDVGYLRANDTKKTTGEIHNIKTGNSGNLPPYITCYIWSRIS